MKQVISSIYVSEKNWKMFLKKNKNMPESDFGHKSEMGILGNDSEILW